MADTTTPNFGYTLPEVGASDNTWGTKLNANWTKADAQFKSVVDSIADALNKKVYPVGALYLSTVATNPATILGFGTWVAHAAGRAIVGVGTADDLAWTVNQTRGEAVTTLGIGHLPSHAHSANPPSQTFTTGGNSVGHTHPIDPPTANTDNYTHSHSGLTGGEGSHNHQVFTYTASGNVGMIAIDQPSDGSNRFYDANSNLAYFADLGELRNNVYSGFPRNLDGTGNHAHSISSDTHDHNLNIPPFNSGTQSANHTHSVVVDIAPYNTGLVGSGTPHNTVQPSIAVYIWRRTA